MSTVGISESSCVIFDASISVKGTREAQGFHEKSMGETNMEEEMLGVCGLVVGGWLFGVWGCVFGGLGVCCTNMSSTGADGREMVQIWAQAAEKD